MGGQREVEYELFLEDQDKVRVHWIARRDRIMAFTAQYEALIEERYYPAERYDTAHGHAHRDSLDWHGQTVRTTPMRGVNDYNDALTHAEDDLKQNWRTYRAAFLRRKP